MLCKNLNCTCDHAPQDFWYDENSYAEYLRKRHRMPEGQNIIVKQGFILKPALRDRFIETETDIYQAINREIENATKEIQSFINDSGAISNILIHEELRSETK